MRAPVCLAVRTPHAPEKSCAARSTVGTYNPIAGAASNSSCLQCIAGKANPVPGSSDASFCVDCQPGTIAPNNGTGSCHKCVAGTFQNEAGKTACDLCPAGSYCPEGASAALPCAEGSYSAATDLASADQCTPTEAGHFAPTGSTQQMPCSPGTVAPNASMGACTKCEAGTFQAEPGQLVCGPCTPGSYCAEGAAAALPCKAGTYQNATMLQLSLSMTGPDDCLECPPGSACGTGAAEPSPCSPGTVAPNASMAACDRCAAGKYQPDEGEQACLACEPGSYCLEGASAALPCPEGSYSSSTSLTSAGECTLTEMGHYAPTGSISQTVCTRGTYANKTGMPTCALCEPGKYQPEAGATACIACAVASYCPGFGSTSSIPCPGGTYSNVSGLDDVLQCTGVEPNFWAPTGSVFPEECPKSGFTCPGSALDVVNKPPGSKPILIDAGQASVNIIEDVITFSLEFNAGPNEFVLKEAIAQLATHYQVDANLISAEATPLSNGRRLTSNGTTNAGNRLLLNITILIPEKAEDEATTPETFASHLAEFGTPELFGVPSSLTQEMTISTRTRQESVNCPKGYCKALPSNHQHQSYLAYCATIPRLCGGRV